MPRTRRTLACLVPFFVAVVTSLMLSACGGGGGSSGTAATTALDNQWDQMQWDTDTWE